MWMTSAVAHVFIHMLIVPLDEAMAEDLIHDCPLARRLTKETIYYKVTTVSSLSLTAIFDT